MARLVLTIKREMDRRGELSGSLVLKPEIGSSGPTKKPAVQVSGYFLLPFNVQFTRHGQ